MSFDKIVTPSHGQKVTVVDGKVTVPDEPILLFIEGDGIGTDITTAIQAHLGCRCRKSLWWQA